MSNTASLLQLTRFWLCSLSDSARIELTDGTETHQVVCSLGRCWFSGDVQVGEECPEDERPMLLAAITAGESDDERFQGWDRSFNDALDAADAQWVSQQEAA
jgi:hypothetical protein